jgi:anaerobic magnesium-protoporphyrin IX monomethyl ester cyclase
MAEILFIDVWGGVPMYPSLSLGYLSSIAKQEGFSTKIISPNILPDFSEGLFTEILRKENPKYCAFTIFTTQVFNTYKLIKIAKKFGCIILAGGPHASSLGAKEVLKECNEIDHLFIKESEEIFRTFLRVKTKKRIIEMKNFIEKIDSLPFPDRSPYNEKGWGYDSNYIKKPIHILISSRGCPYNCRFCFKGTFGFKYRQRDINNILDECEEIIKGGGKELYFIDDLFTFDKDWIISFCKQKIKRKIGIPFKCLGRIDRVDKEILRWLKKAKCHTIAIGVESGDQEIIDWNNKNITLEQVRNTVKKIHQAGINIESYFIIGHRIDTEKTIHKTIEFAREINTDFPRFFLFSPYPGSQVWKELPEEFKDKYWLKGIESELRSSNPISICEIKPNQLVELWHKAHDRVYSNPKYLLNVFRSFKQNPFNRIWIKKLVNFVGGGILKLHRKIRQ